jgi:hypothetical protein
VTKNKRSNSLCAHIAKKKCSRLSTLVTTMSFTSGAAAVASCRTQKSKGGNMPEAAKRYWLFGGECYYAAGGWDDRRGMYDTIAEAVAEGKRQRGFASSTRLQDVYEWWHVVDIATGEIVAGSALQAHGAADLTPEQIGGDS